MKSAALHKQGLDASLEQVIKKSKKGAKIQARNILYMNVAGSNRFILSLGYAREGLEPRVQDNGGPSNDTEETYP